MEARQPILSSLASLLLLALWPAQRVARLWCWLGGSVKCEAWWGSWTWGVCCGAGRRRVVWSARLVRFLRPLSCRQPIALVYVYINIMPAIGL